MTKGVYRYDERLYALLRETSIAGDLPFDALYRLPEWCVYIETPDMMWEDRTLHGMWVHLEWSEHGADELRLLLDVAQDVDNPLDAEHGLVPIPVILGAGGLAAGLDRVIKSSKRQAALQGVLFQGTHFAAPALAGLVAPLLSLVLYLCAANADIVDSTNRSSTAPAGDDPLLRSNGATIWEVGTRIGAALGDAHQTAQEGGATTSLAHQVRPYLRRAHWHTYLVGAGRRERRLKWSPPIQVNIGQGKIDRISWREPKK